MRKDQQLVEVTPTNGDKKYFEEDVHEKRVNGAPVKHKKPKKKKRNDDDGISFLDYNVDCIANKLNNFMTKDDDARRNWRRIRFRLQVIS